MINFIRTNHAIQARTPLGKRGLRDVESTVIEFEWFGNSFRLLCSTCVFGSFFGPDRAKRSIAFLSF